MEAKSSYLNIFFFNDTATTEIYTLSLHDALPISRCKPFWNAKAVSRSACHRSPNFSDRKSTRLNSSHLYISYAVFCLEKTKKQKRKSIARTTRCRSISLERP